MSHSGPERGRDETGLGDELGVESVLTTPDRYRYVIDGGNGVEGGGGGRRLGRKRHGNNLREWELAIGKQLCSSQEGRHKKKVFSTGKNTVEQVESGQIWGQRW